jgi:hypothetical protein
MFFFALAVFGAICFLVCNKWSEVFSCRGACGRIVAVLLGTCICNCAARQDLSAS